MPQRFAQAVEGSPVAQIITDAEHRIEYVNSKFVSLLGFASDEIIGKDIGYLRLDGTDNIERRAALGAGEEWSGRLQNRRKAGPPLWMFEFASPVRDAAGAITHYLIVTLDVGQRREDFLGSSSDTIRLCEIADNIREVFWILDCDSRRVIYVSPGYLHIWGRDVDSLYKNPSSWFDAIHADDRQRVLDSTVNRWISGDYNEEYRVVRPDGTIRWVRDRAFPVRNTNGAVNRIVGIAQDITLAKRTESLLVGEKRALELIAQSGPLQAVLELLIGVLEEQIDGMLGAVLLYDETRHRLTHGAAPSLPDSYNTTVDGLAVWPGASPASSAVHSRTRVGSEDISRDDRWPKFAPLAQELGVRGCWATPVLINSRAVGAFCLHFKESRALAAWEWELIDRIVHLAGIAVERKQAEVRVAHQANYDELTGLPNRLLFVDLVKQAITAASRHKRLVGVMFLDLDRFKTINDTLGHDAGDTLIKAVAERISGCLRRGDAMARLGGDEFIIMLADMGHADDAMRVAQKLLSCFTQPYRVAERDLIVSASIGISIYPVDSPHLENLLKNADSAMYRAKEHGRNTYRFYTAEMNAKAYDRLILENSLHKAIERNEFMLHYQPQVDIATGTVVGVEALVRWKHPDIGLVPPFEFIPLSEETGLIVPIGEWVLRTACAQNKRWQEMGLPPMRVAVNLSPRQFRQPGLVQMVMDVLDQTKLEPIYLELEITEGTLMQDVETTIGYLRQLKQHGVHLSIDDFGTGYSSLSYLKRFPINSLKVDRSFVQDVIKNTDDAAITRAIINMAHHLGVHVIAEGVETVDQLSFLREHLCDFMQGYYFSKPLPAEDLTKLLQEDRRLPIAVQQAAG